MVSYGLDVNGGVTSVWPSRPFLLQIMEQATNGHDPDTGNTWLVIGVRTYPDSFANGKWLTLAAEDRLAAAYPDDLSVALLNTSFQALSPNDLRPR